MLFEVSREAMVSSLGEENVFLAPSGSLGSKQPESHAARILLTTGIPTGVFQPQKRMPSGRFPLVNEKIDLTHHENVPADCGSWPVFGWLPQTHLAFDPETGVVHGFSENGGPVQALHTDMSSLAYLTFALQRLLKEFPWSDDEDEEEADFERLAEALHGIRATVEERDPLPFGGDSVWPAVLDDMEAGMWS
ncbi:hypothetical protein GTW40_16565 [Streptomyces sp. SID4985]|uniref:SUKH-4 family immunity protein n=1 Tax=Streptomyces sp. SID4985 TaxID=2690292 RepID=UPI00136E03D5|nr:SUKH-4 family immunity protein [Streptomyces sp. SID4985]MYQ46649.1 hypothetical protein [Streptomyces sp. SID4985]